MYVLHFFLFSTFQLTAQSIKDSDAYPNTLSLYACMSSRNIRSVFLLSHFVNGCTNIFVLIGELPTEEGEGERGREYVKEETRTKCRL